MKPIKKLNYGKILYFCFLLVVVFTVTATPVYATDVWTSFNNSAINAATDKGGGLFGKKAFESSLKSGGDLAKDVIGKVATGEIAKTGSITGETANKALSTYLGYDGGASMFDTDASGSSAIPTETGSIEESADSTMPVEASSAPGIETSPEVGTISDVPGTSVPSVTDIASNSETAATATQEDIPLESASDVMQSPEIQNIDYPSEMNPDMNTDIATQPEISEAAGETARRELKEIMEKKKLSKV